MSTLKDEEVKDIARKTAEANNVQITSVSTSSLFDTTGVPTLEITLMIPAGTTATVAGLSSANMTSQLIQRLADQGEERLPLVSFEEQRATPGS
jgi:hypothetical protein